VDKNVIRLSLSFVMVDYKVRGGVQHDRHSITRRTRQTLRYGKRDFRNSKLYENKKNENSRNGGTRLENNKKR